MLLLLQSKVFVEVGEQGFGTKRHEDNTGTDVYRPENMPRHNTLNLIHTFPISSDRDHAAAASAPLLIHGCHARPLRLRPIQPRPLTPQYWGVRIGVVELLVTELLVAVRSEGDDPLPVVDRAGGLGGWLRLRHSVREVDRAGLGTTGTGTGMVAIGQAS